MATTVAISPALRLDLFGETMFRLRHSSLGPDPFPPKYETPFAMAAGTTWAPVAYECTPAAFVVTVRTARLVIHVRADNGDFIVEDALDGRRLYPTNGPYHGLCSQGSMAFDSAAGLHEPSTASRHAHWFHNPTTGRYDIHLAEDAILDRFFIHGPGYPELFAQFNALVGPEPLLTRKGYGFYQTQHLGFIGDQAMLLRTVEEFRRRGIPLDTIILDFEWGDGSTGESKAPWGSRLDWATSYSQPLAPAAMMTKLREQNVEVMLIHHSVPDDAGRAARSWTAYKYPPELWWAKLQEKLDQGVVGTWQDTRANDVVNSSIYAGLQQRLGPGRRASFIGNYDLFLDCNWARLSQPQPTLQEIGGRRTPFAWTGDKSNDRWTELRFQVEAITNRFGSMRGISHLCDDMMRSADWRLAVRSLQFHCFNTIARSHNLKPWQVTRAFQANEEMAITGATAGGPARARAMQRTPEHYLGLEAPHAQQEELFRRFLRLRYRLLPYLYSLVHHGYRTGMPVCRPMLMAFPDDPAVNRDQWPGQYLFGDDFLVAPVCDDQGAIDVWLPQASDWIDFWSDWRFRGGQVLRLATDDLSRFPLFVRHGAVVPTQEPCEWIKHGQVPDPLVLEVWPSTTGGACRLIEDDSVSLAYQQGRVCETAISCRREPANVVLEIAPTKGDYDGRPDSRRVLARLHRLDQTVRAVETEPARGATTWRQAGDVVEVELRITARGGCRCLVRLD